MSCSLSLDVDFLMLEKADVLWFPLLRVGMDCQARSGQQARYLGQAKYLWNTVVPYTCKPKMHQGLGTFGIAEIRECSSLLYKIQHRPDSLHQLKRIQIC